MPRGFLSPSNTIAREVHCGAPLGMRLQAAQQILGIGLKDAESSVNDDEIQAGALDSLSRSLAFRARTSEVVDVTPERVETVAQSLRAHSQDAADS